MVKKKIYALRIKYKDSGNVVIRYENKKKRDEAKVNLKKDRTIKETIDVVIYE